MVARVWLKRRRNAARFSLYGSLFLTLGLGLVLYPVFRGKLVAGLDQSWAGVDWEELEEVRLLQALLRVDTTPETGSEIDAARLLERELGALGLETHVESLPGNKANIWAILEGDDPQALVLHSHLDSDPIVHRNRWIDSPWSGKIEPPWIYGRGAYDMKSYTVAQVQAIKALVRRGERPHRSVIFLATSSEETGSELGARRMLSEHPDVISRVWALLTEGGLLEAVDRRQVKWWGTEFAQKRFVKIHVRDPDLARLETLERELHKRGQPTSRLRVVPEIEDFIALYGPSRDNPEYRRLLSDPHALIANLEDYNRLPRYLKALFRSEIYAFSPVPEADGGYGMRLMIHLIPGDDLDEVLPDLLPESLVAGLDVEIERLETAAHGSPLEHPALATINAMVNERSDVVRGGPHYLSFYATDCRFFRLADVPCYGFTPFVLLSTDSFTITGPNERIALPAFVEGVEFYVELVERLAGAKSDKAPSGEGPKSVALALGTAQRRP